MSQTLTSTTPPPAEPPARAEARPGFSPILLAPAVASALALAAHLSIPNKQSALPTLPYPYLLVSLAAGGVGLVLCWLAWPGSRGWIRFRAPLLTAIPLLLSTWDLVTLKFALLPLPYFPGPDLVLRGLWDDRDVLAESTWHSLRLLLSGYLLGVCLGLFSGILIGWSRAARYWGMPLLKLFGPIPATAFIPLAMALFSSAYVSGTALIALAVWFPVTMLTSSGIANVPVSYLEVARTLGAKWPYLVFRVAVPAALPSIFIGLFMGMGASFLTLMVAETVGVKSGLGWYLKWQQGYLEYAKVYAALSIMSVFFSGLMTLLFRVRDRILSWQKGVIRW